MNPETGQVYAMGSNPSYNPGDYTREYKALLANKDNPLVNKAVNGEGPDGSTFKVITATAALQSGAWGLNQIYDDTGR